MKLSPGVAADVYITGQREDPDWQIIQNNVHIIEALVRTRKVEVVSTEPSVGFTCTGVLRSLKIILPMPEELLKQELQRLLKEKEKLSASQEKLRAQLSNPEFTAKAPPALIEKQRGLMTNGEMELQEITKKLDLIQNRLMI